MLEAEWRICSSDISLQAADMPCSNSVTFKIDFNFAAAAIASAIVRLLKKLSSQLMRLPLTALFLESVMTFLYTRKLFLCLIFLKYTSHFYQKMYIIQYLTYLDLSEAE
jgi:hypothetical protein